MNMVQPIHVTHNCYLTRNTGRHTFTLLEYDDVTRGGFHPRCASYNSLKYFIDCREPGFVGTSNVDSVYEYRFWIKDMEHHFWCHFTQAPGSFAYRERRLETGSQKYA